MRNTEHQSREQRLKSCLEKFYATLSFVGQTSKPIKFEPVNEPKAKTVVVMGCIGQGKSSILNKLQYLIDKNQPKLGKYFNSSNDSKTVTIEIKSLEMQGESFNIRLIDTQGFECPEYSGLGEVWIRMIEQITAKESELLLDQDGISLFLFPIMISNSFRVENKSVKLMNELLMFLTVCYPKYF